MEIIMIIAMSNIGTVLDSRPAGREALLAVRPRLQNERNVVLDFTGVQVLTPSFADEFVTSLIHEPKCTVRLIHTQDNITVRKTLAFLQEEWGKDIRME
jgi:hypothetical protein